MKIPKQTKRRFCECGCGQVIYGTSTKKFFDNACRQRFFRAKGRRENLTNRYAKLLDQRYADQKRSCLILFDAKGFPLEIQFGDHDRLQSAAETWTWKLRGGNFYKIYAEAV